MNRESGRCPDPEVLAAFVAGSLTGAELKMVADHVLECEECRIVLRDAAQYERTSTTATGPALVEEPVRRPWWLAAAAAALAGVVALSIWYVSQRRTTRWIDDLAEAAPRDARWIEPRLSGGLNWAPLKAERRVRGESADPARLKLSGVAGDVLEQTAGDPSPSAQHAAGLARLLAGDPRAAAATLENIAAQSNDARVWSDLAAARYQAGVLAEDPQQFGQALGAADEALRHNPRLPEALFNRALILEQLGLREQARTAWQAFIAVEANSEWSREAQLHITRLRPSAEFRQELERRYQQIARDQSAAIELAATFPQQTRVWGESEILNRWGLATLAGNAASGELHLSVARQLGEALHRRGESLLHDAVKAIGDADTNRRRTLAQAHVAYREAQQLFTSDGAAAAEPRFRDAVALFQSAGSPMKLPARYFAANVAYELGYLQQAYEQLASLRRDRNANYPALTAQIDWEIGLVHSAQGRWGKAMHAFENSIAAFDQLGETQYAMTVRELVAEVYDRLGEPRTAWMHRIEALHELGRNDDLRLRATLHAIARGAALTRDWRVALSFIDLETAPPRHPGDELMRVTALLTRARLRAQVRAETDARFAFERASVALGRVTDAGARDRAEAEVVATEALIASVPSKAIALLTRAIDFHREKGRRMFLPEMLLHRGRAFAAAGAANLAAADFDSGISEMEAQRRAISNAEDRWGIFGSADDLFTDAATLALERNDADAALEYCDRARGRELVDALTGGAAMPRVRSGATNALVVEYLMLPQRLVIFVMDGDRTRAVQRQIDETDVNNQIVTLADSARAGDKDRFRRVSSRLYQQLLAPVDDDLRDNRMLVVVPDPALEGVPFAALIDGAGHYLVESRAVVVTPSVAAFHLLAARQSRRDPASRLLLIAGPGAQDGAQAQLTSARAEAEAIASLYPSSDVLAPRTDPSEAFERSAADADVIHFVGHAMPSSQLAGGALVTSREERLEAQLHVRDIASMRLRKPRVVVLAACATGRAYGRTGEASISIARAFLAAGAPAVIATLWPIDDSQAAEFFPRIHSFLSRGMPPAEALRAAQLEWLHRHDTPPGVWAAVEIIGS